MAQFSVDANRLGLLAPPTGGRGWARPFPHEGWGWVVFPAAEAVRRSAGPLACRSPNQSLHPGRGRSLGSAVERPAHDLPSSWVDEASRPMCQLAWCSGCSDDDATSPRLGVTACDLPLSAADGAAVEPRRALQSLQRPGSGRGGWPGNDRAGGAIDASAAPVSSSSVLAHVQSEGRKDAISARGRAAAAATQLR